MTTKLDMTKLWNAVVKARKEAKEEAQASSDFKFQFSRGAHLCTLDEKGQCSPNPQAEACEWSCTLKEIYKLLEKQERYEFTEIYIAGGWDSAESMIAYKEGDYNPWDSEWIVAVWTKTDGFNKELLKGN